MQKPLSKDIHGLIDYTYAFTVPLLPEVVGFKKENAAKVICMALGAGALGYSLITKAKWGLYRVLPFNTHLAIDISVSCLALVTPWIFGFSKNAKARNTLLSVGLAGLTAATLTRTDADLAEQREMFI